jgi:hypothetical protein
VNNDIVTRNPVDGGGDAVLVASLKAVEDTEDLGTVAACAGGIREDKTNGLLGVDDEDRANGERDALLVDICGILVVDPVTLSDFRFLDIISQHNTDTKTYMSYARATSLCLSPIIGKVSLLPEISSISLIHPAWLSIVLAERPMSFAPRLVNSGSSLAKAPSSVVQTGV